MIDYDRTLSILGVDVNELSHSSGKRVFAVCDECGKYREVPYYAYRELCISCSHRGRIGYWRGKHRNEDVKHRIRTTNKGKKRTDVARNRIRKAKTGEKNPNWKGGKVEKVCKQCGKTFEVDPNRENDAWFCSNRCNGVYLSIHQSGENNPNWNGGASFEPYCSKFNEQFKESIRELFNRLCFLCSTTEGNDGRKLSVHHVNYHKACLCDDVECEFVPLCRRCHAKTNANRDFWERLIIYALPYHEEERIIECMDILEMVTSNGKTCSWTASSCTI